jgi:molecular chaperone HscA
MKNRALAEERVDAARLVEATTRALETDGNCCPPTSVPQSTR